MHTSHRDINCNLSLLKAFVTNSFDLILEKLPFKSHFTKHISKYSGTPLKDHLFYNVTLHAWSLSNYAIYAIYTQLNQSCRATF